MLLSTEELLDKGPILKATEISKFFENVLEGQTLRIPSYVTMPASNIPIATSQEDRVDIAMEAAVKWLNNSKKAGWA